MDGEGRAKITISVRPSVPRFEKMHIWPNRMTGATVDSQTSDKVLLKLFSVCPPLLSSLVLF